MMMAYNDALVMESQFVNQFVTSNVVQWKATESRWERSHAARHSFILISFQYTLY